MLRTQCSKWSLLIGLGVGRGWVGTHLSGCDLLIMYYADWIQSNVFVLSFVKHCIETSITSYLGITYDDMFTLIC